MARSLIMVRALAIATATTFLLQGGTIAAEATKLQVSSSSSSLPTYTQANWMGATMDVIGNLTLLDITLPGTHDTNTWDLSSTVADNSNDVPPWLSFILHDFGDFEGIGQFAQSQAVSQTLNLTQQLDAGIRYLDFRADWSAPIGVSSSDYDKYQWYSLHLLESHHTAMELFQQVKDWMIAHPTEVVVLWVSHWGDSCGDHYHNCPASVMHQFFLNYTGLFGDMVFDGLLNETTISSMVQSNKRAVFYIASYNNMTDGGSPLAQNACGGIDNNLGYDITNLPNTLTKFQETYSNARTRQQQDKKKNAIYLESMTGGSPKKQILEEFIIARFHYFLNVSGATRTCSKAYNIPNMTEFCPATLRQDCQLANYYSQWVFEQALNNASVYLPGAIYINVVGNNGTLCTGVDTDYTAACETGYAYVDTVVLYNIVKNGRCSIEEAGSSSSSGDDAVCSSLVNQIKKARSLYPARYYSDPKYGRHVNWPFQLDKN